MGVNATIKVNPEWKEPAVLWTVVAAKKGERKSPAQRRLTGPIYQVQRELREPFTDINTSAQQEVPQLLIDNFSMEELHAVLKRNNGQVSLSTHITRQIVDLSSSPIERAKFSFHGLSPSPKRPGATIAFFSLRYRRRTRPSLISFSDATHVTILSLR